MKKLIFFSLLIAASLGVIVYVAARKEKIKLEQAKPTVIESIASSSASMSSESSMAKPTVPDFRLRILSEPAGAEIFFDGESVGKTPFEVAVPGESRRMRLVLNGYDDYERQVPAARDSEGDLVWKIQLKKKQIKKAVKFFMKEIAPFSVQIKAIPMSDFAESDENFDDVKNDLKFCRVVINSKAGEKIWVRVVAGPYSTKAKASAALSKIKVTHPDAFLSTKHKCIGGDK
jgi:hypothetical protein